MNAAVGKISQAEAFARIRLLRSANVGPVTYRQLLARFHTASEALVRLPELASRGGGRAVAADANTVRAEVDAVRRVGARYLFHDDPAYPGLLAELASAPPVLIYRGDQFLLSLPAVAIVGARNASAAAVRMAHEFAEALAQTGRLVVSGLARGIDDAAHGGALRSGKTCAVIAGGIDVAYPPQHAELQEQIASEGVLVSEQPPGTVPQARHFPSRNRIIAGLAAGTLVVEAVPRSGSLITARIAGDAGREVMAVPGSPRDPRAGGCNQLIRDGAILVQTPEDVAELLNGFMGQPRSGIKGDATDFVQVDSTSVERESADSADIEAMLSSAPVSVDELVRQSGMETAAVQFALVELELAGRLQRHPGGRVSLS